MYLGRPFHEYQLDMSVDCALVSHYLYWPPIIDVIQTTLTAVKIYFDISVFIYDQYWGNVSGPSLYLVHM